jgi:L-histidine N-alpha-methyltransferase
MTALTQAASTPAPQGRSAFAADLLAGLAAAPKRIPPKYFYDPAGSRLFERITELPEYYPTRTECGILKERASEIARFIPEAAALVEFGSGSSQKVRLLLEKLPTLGAYVPVDISAEFLDEEAARLRREFPHLTVIPVAADFTRSFALPSSVLGRPRAGFFPGSTIGNFEPMEAEGFLRHAARILGTGAPFVIGVDLVKDAHILNAAYNDAEGVTAAFNLNLLARANRELGADFDLDAFAHRAFFNQAASRIEMHLVSRKRQTVRLLGHVFAFAPDETIHTENSYKYTLDGFTGLAGKAGWRSEAAWTDAERLFSVHMLRAGDAIP